MKIVYYAQSRSGSDATESHISKAFTELGHEVVVVVPGSEVPTCDLILFHKDIPPRDTPAICWYFDKIEFSQNRVQFIRKALARATVVFVTDETYTKASPHPKFRVVRQGIGDFELGEPVELAAKVAFAGTVYGPRLDFCTKLAIQYGEDFQVFAGVNNRDFNNLCVSVPIFVTPRYPSDDYYWSNRVYLTLGSGGFLIHPRLKGLEAEYEDGKEIVFYDSLEDLFSKVDYYLAHPEEREMIRLAGWEKTKSMYTYKKRVEEILCILASTQLAK